METAEEEQRHSSDEALEVDLPVDAVVQSDEEEDDQEENEDFVAEESTATSGVGKHGYAASKRARLDSGGSNGSGGLSGDRSSCSVASSGSSGDETFKDFTLSRGNQDLQAARRAEKADKSIIELGNRKAVKLAAEIARIRLQKAQFKATKRQK